MVIVISDEDEGEKRQDKEPPAPRRSLRLLGVKRKNYIEHTPEPKNYAGDSDWESYMSPGFPKPSVTGPVPIWSGMKPVQIQNLNLNSKNEKFPKKF